MGNAAGIRRGKEARGEMSREGRRNTWEHGGRGRGAEAYAARAVATGAAQRRERQTVGEGRRKRFLVEIAGLAGLVAVFTVCREKVSEKRPTDDKI